MEIDLDAIRAKLLARRAELLADSQHAQESTQAVELDQTRVGRLSRMDALQMQAVAKETEVRRKLELVQIDAALQRLEEGDYGYCARCDEPINPKRLEHNPSIPTCITCASRAEQEA
uniref:Putative TraR/DksA family Transcriptional regulator n=1 Tax=Magnetococcus massalia (strain MO-1) TaxID=451514 RepID=A0A1S7LD60_MAGMO|nr:putative TraR/DksA family Transcriptional regulator [Candidatus Magnetococcus massalia]